MQNNILNSLPNNACIVLIFFNKNYKLGSIYSNKEQPIFYLIKTIQL